MAVRLSWLRFPSLFLLTICLSVGTADAQFRAAIQGTVTDATGAAVPGATVVATNQETGVSAETITSDAGFYRVSGLSPGKYKVTASLSGFKEGVAESIAALGGYFTATRQPDNAVAAFLREIENSPDHVPARLGITAVKAETDPAVALEYAEAAVRLNPRIPLGHYLLGKLLLTTSQVDRAISELETAERSVRDDPGVYYALGRAYARAGRTQDAERARATFQRLMQERERAAR